MSAISLEDVIEFIEGLEKYESLEPIKDAIAITEKMNYDRKENFKYHEKKDDYIYVVYYPSGEKWRHHIGKIAYEKYCSDSDAYKITRETKDLFPISETLLEKAYW